MPEHTNDPIHDLEHFGTGGLAVTPMDPAQVRRLGDRRRNRRRGAVAVAASIVAVTAVVAPLALLSDNGDQPSPMPSPSAPPTPAPTPSGSATGTTPAVITYPGNGIEVTSAADTAKLTGTTQEFRDFIAQQAQKAVSDGTSCPDAAHGITVQKYSSAGYAIGGVNTCGGYMALWVDHEDQWQEGFGTQDTWDCPTLRYFGVPRSFAGDCFNYSGDFGPTEVSGLRLGMTAAEVTAAGGTVTPGSDGACGGVVLPDRTAAPGVFDANLSPTKGLAGIFARPGMKTPEKIGLGSTLAQFRAAYPDATFGIDFWRVPLGDGAEYEVLADKSGMVYEIALALRTQDCFG